VFALWPQALRFQGSQQGPAHFVLDEQAPSRTGSIPQGQRFAHNSFFCGIEPARESDHHHNSLWCEWGGIGG